MTAAPRRASNSTTPAGRQIAPKSGSRSVPVKRVSKTPTSKKPSPRYKTLTPSKPPPTLTFSNITAANNNSVSNNKRKSQEYPSAEHHHQSHEEKHKSSAKKDAHAKKSSPFKSKLRSSPQRKCKSFKHRMGGEKRTNLWFVDLINIDDLSHNNRSNGMDQRAAGSA